MGEKASIPLQGHVDPIKISGANEAWKNAQKKDKKKKTSDVINKIIPICSPFTTSLVWSPFNKPSRVISRHHWNLIRISVKILKNTFVNSLPFI